MSEISYLAKRKRQQRIRRKIVGTQDIPRMSIFRSLCHIYVQLVDDINGKSLLGCSTLSKKFLEMYNNGKKDIKKNRSNKKSADILGKVVAQMALDKGIKRIVFDRSGYKYHGAVQALADSARKAGLQF